MLPGLTKSDRPKSIILHWSILIKKYGVKAKKQLKIYEVSKGVEAVLLL
jgi:hypothetical protein